MATSNPQSSILRTPNLIFIFLTCAATLLPSRCFDSEISILFEN